MPNPMQSFSISVPYIYRVDANGALVRDTVLTVGERYVVQVSVTHGGAKGENFWRELTLRLVFMGAFRGGSNRITPNTADGIDFDQDPGVATRTHIVASGRVYVGTSYTFASRFVAIRRLRIGDMKFNIGLYGEFVNVNHIWEKKKAAPLAP